MSNGNLIGRHPNAIAKDPFYAAHEAAHGVTIDDKGWTVHEVDLDKRQTHADTANFWDAVKAAKTKAQKEAIAPRVLAYVTTLVAGYIAEKQIDSPEQSVSQRIAAAPWLLEMPPPNLNGDTNRAMFLLQWIGRNTEQVVAQAEADAVGILQRRKAHHDALVAKLTELRVVNGNALSVALGKVAADAPPAKATPVAPAETPAPA